MNSSRLFALLAATTLLFGCIHIYEPRPSAAPSPAKKEDKEKDKPPLKPWKEVLKDTEEIEGLLPMHLKRDRTLYLELAPDQLGRDYGMVLHYSRGLGDFNVHDGLQLSSTRLIRFERVGDTVYLVDRNPRFTAEPGSPMRRSIDDNTGHSILDAWKVASEKKDSKHLLVDVTTFFVSDYANVSERLKFYYGNKPVSFDKERSYVASVKGFPRNVELDAMLTYKAGDFPTYGGEGVSDYRSIPVSVRYSLFALPDQPMPTRLADDRVGYFLKAVEDFSRDRQETPYIRYIERWRLEPKTPDKLPSEPVKPIVFYVDRSVPHEYRPYVKQGIEGWNKAFEQAGFNNAIVAREAPEDDASWSAEDIRYSTVRWTAAHRMGYAIGPSQVDPRSGEILNADILISSSFVRGWLYAWQQLGPGEMATRLLESQRLPGNLPREMAERVCVAELGKSHQLGVQYAWLAALGKIEPGAEMPEEYLGDAIRDLVLHEVGHTLGLRHNFKASSAIAPEKLHDTQYTKQRGIAVSVMDYLPVNISADPAKQGHYWDVTVGDYDLWAIEYGY
ncbi:MAG: DUF5117 domain-containing protein, partial [Acidobacteriota bacterium]